MRANDESVQVVDADLLARRDRNDLLREHVERIARDARLLDLALAHGARDDRTLEEVGPELREDPALRDRTELVPRPADALQAARDRLRRLDLDHEIDGAHVDAQFEARRRHQARDAAGLQILLDDHPLLAGQRAVMRTRDLAFGELVQTESEPLGEAPVVHEHDRRAVLVDQLQDRRVDRRPDRARAVLGTAVHLLPVEGHRLGERGRRAELAKVVDGNDDLEVELLARARVDELDRAAARDEAPDLLERALGRAQRDALERGVDEPLEPLDRQRKMSTPLRPGDGVHLVEDQRLDPPERLARLRRQQQVERLGRGDQDVGRLLHHLPAFLGGCVAGAHRNPQVRLEPCERPAQVALDVVVECLQRRDVEDAQPLAGRLGQPVDRVEERGDRLAGTGRRLDQHVRARGDRRPAALLRRRRRVERALEPGPGCGREEV